MSAPTTPIHQGAQGGRVRASSQPVRIARITSYNVCYTKLLRYSLVRGTGSLFLAGDRGQQFALSYLGDGRFLGRSAGINALGETNHDAEAEFISYNFV